MGEEEEEQAEAERVHLDLDETMFIVNDQKCPKCRCMAKNEDRGCQTDYSLVSTGMIVEMKKRAEG